MPLVIVHSEELVLRTGGEMAGMRQVERYACR
jgi:hypothetical protein